MGPLRGNTSIFVALLLALIAAFQLIFFLISPNVLLPEGDKAYANALRYFEIPSSLSPSLRTPVNNVIGENAKFLLYFSKEGWSNQQQCLMNAYIMAKAAGRVLVTAPVLPHKNWGLDLHNNVTEAVKNGTIPLPSGEAIVKFYREFAPDHNYVAMDKVLDFQYSLPDVTTIDFQTFYQKYWLPGRGVDGAKKLTEWVMETEYYNHDTLWIKDRPDLETPMMPTNYTYLWYNGVVPIDEKWKRKDIAKLSHGDSRELWTLYDAFEPAIHSSLYSEDYYQFRFSAPIRDAARMIRKNWGDIPYASVHIRLGGGDTYGCFMEKDTKKMTIENTMWKIMLKIQAWLDVHTGENRPPVIGLFVATDKLKELLSEDKWPEFKSRRDEITNMFKTYYDVEVKYFYSDSFQFDSPDVTEQLKTSVGQAGIFLDQQVAGCAQIAFHGTRLGHCASTFSRLIYNIRHSPGAC